MSTDGNATEAARKAAAFVRGLIPILKASADAYQTNEVEDGSPDADATDAYVMDSIDDVLTDDSDLDSREQELTGTIGDDYTGALITDNDDGDLYAAELESDNDDSAGNGPYTSELTPDSSGSNAYASELTHGDSSPRKYYASDLDYSETFASQNSTEATRTPEQAIADRKQAIAAATQKQRGCEQARDTLVALQERAKAAHQAFENANEELSRKVEAGTSEEELGKFEMLAVDVFRESLESVVKEAESVECFGQPEFERFKSKLVESCNLYLGKAEPQEVTIGVDADQASDARFQDELGAVKEKVRAASADERAALIAEMHQVEANQECLTTLRSITAELAKAWDDYESAQKNMQRYLEQLGDQPPDENSSAAQDEMNSKMALSNEVDRHTPTLEAINPPLDEKLYQLWDNALAFCNTISGQPPGSQVPQPAGFDDVTKRQKEDVRKVKSEVFVKLAKEIEQAKDKFFATRQNDFDDAQVSLDRVVTSIRRRAEEAELGGISGRAARQSDLGLQDAEVAELKQQVLRRCDELLKLAGEQVESPAAAPATERFFMPDAAELQASKEQEAAELEQLLRTLPGTPDIAGSEPGRFLDVDGLDETLEEGGTQSQEEQAATEQMLERLGLGNDPAAQKDQPPEHNAIGQAAEGASDGSRAPEANEIEIGDVTSANPTLWFSNVNNEERYQIATTSPGNGWQSVTQFCSVLTVMWLNRPSASLSFANATKKDQIKMARLLIKNWRLDDQVSFAAKELGGTTVDKGTVQQALPTYGPKTKIWFGNNAHVMGALVQDETNILVYDSNSGGTTAMTKDQFVGSTQRANAFVVAAKPQTNQTPDAAASTSWQSATPSGDSDTDRKPGTYAVEETDMISGSTRQACADVLGFADLICRFEAVFEGSVDPDAFRAAADRATAQCKSKLNALVESLRVATVKKQAEEKQGDKQASTEALKLVKQGEKNVAAHLAALRASVRKYLESAGIKSVQTIGTTMFRSRRGIWLDPDAFENPPIDLGNLPKALSSASDLAKVGETAVSLATKALETRNRLVAMLSSGWDPIPANIDQALTLATAYGSTLDELLAVQRQIAKPDGIVTSFLASNKAALRQSPSLQAAQKALASLKKLERSIDGPILADQAVLDSIIADLQDPRDKQLVFRPQVTSLRDHTKTVQTLRAACLVLSKALQKSGK